MEQKYTWELRQIRDKLKEWRKKRKEISQSKQVTPLSVAFHIEDEISILPDSTAPYVSFRNSSTINNAIEKGMHSIERVEQVYDQSIDR